MLQVLCFFDDSRPRSSITHQQISMWGYEKCTKTFFKKYYQKTWGVEKRPTDELVRSKGKPLKQGTWAKVVSEDLDPDWFPEGYDNEPDREWSAKQWLERGRKPKFFPEVWLREGRKPDVPDYRYV